MNSLYSQKYLEKSSKELSKSIEKLSSGFRINSAADDAAGMAIASRMTAQIRGMDMAKRNTQDGISMVQTAEGAMGVQVEQLQKARELAVQAANGTLSASDRTKLNTEASGLMSELNEIATDTQFNGNNLLDSGNTFKLQVGANSGETRDVETIDTKSATLGVDAIDLSTTASASTAIDTIDAALETIQSARADMGSYQNRLEQTISSLNVSISNATASRSRIRDTDYAKETAAMTKSQILAQAGIAMLTQANQMPQNILAMLK